MTYQHPEAYCLMTYRSDDGTHEEVLWNSRDGVTPFVIHHRDGTEMAHVSWGSDVCIPDYQPLPGMRIFVDMDEEMAQEAAWRQVERFWDDPQYPASKMFPSKEVMASTLAKDHVGGVTIAEVPSE